MPSRGAFFGSLFAVGALAAGCNLRTGGDDARVARGFAIAPVRLDLSGKDRTLVGLGSYIVNAQSGCWECHTNPPYLPGGTPYFGRPIQINTQHYLAGGQEFPPSPYYNTVPVVSRNITPDEKGNPAGMDFPTFLNAVRNGMRYRTEQSPLDFAASSADILQRAGAENPGTLLEVMPWPVFRMMTDHDIRAVYEYLRAIPHAEPGETPAE